MNILSKYGWADAQQRYYTSLRTELLPARIVSIKGFKHVLMTEKGELEAELTGKLLFDSQNEDLPKVGDWVLYIDYETSGYIVEVLPRKNVLARKTPGKKQERQVLAANIDVAIVVQGLDRDFNIMRLERYIVQIVSSGITPVILLNKADLVQDPEEFVREVDRLKRDCKVYLCSAHTQKGLNQLLEEVLFPARTCVMIGSSGVGKSSILNALMAIQIQQIGSVSHFNLKGKHTTTSRDLFMLPNGCLMIDTPGMREFGVTFDEDMSEEEAFPVIHELAKNCRFKNCDHMQDSGCAVLKALSEGELDPVIYNSYVKLQKEQRRFQISAEERKQQARQFGKMAREAVNHRKKNKF